MDEQIMQNANRETQIEIPHPPSESDVEAARAFKEIMEKKAAWPKRIYRFRTYQDAFGNGIERGFLSGCTHKAAEKDKVIGELLEALEKIRVPHKPGESSLSEWKRCYETASEAIQKHKPAKEG